jgi:hypothetical protein
MNGPTIIVYVSGGRVEAVATDADADAAEIIVIDEDLLKVGEESVSHPWPLSLDGLKEHHPDVFAAALAQADETSYLWPYKDSAH